MEALTKEEALNRLARVRTTLQSYKKQAEKAAVVGTHSILTVAGGGIAGFVGVKVPTIPGTEVPTALALGVLLVGAGALDLGGEYSDEAAALGAGMLAGLAATEGAKFANART